MIKKELTILNSFSPSFSKGILPMSVTPSHVCVDPEYGVKDFRKCCAEKCYKDFIDPEFHGDHSEYIDLISSQWKITKFMLKVLMEKLPESSGEEREMVECSITGICNMWKRARKIYPNYGKFCGKCWEEEWYEYFSFIKTADDIRSDPFLSKVVLNNPITPRIEEMRKCILDSLKDWTNEAPDSESAIERVMEIVNAIMVGEMVDQSDEEIVDKFRKSLPSHIKQRGYSADLTEPLINNIQLILSLLPFVPR